MTIWGYVLQDGKTGQIRAADDDHAWNSVLEQVGECPVELIAIGVVQEVAS